MKPAIKALSTSNMKAAQQATANLSDGGGSEPMRRGILFAGNATSSSAMNDCHKSSFVVIRFVMAP
jgi:hypothetical protein